MSTKPPLQVKQGLVGGASTGTFVVGFSGISHGFTFPQWVAAFAGVGLVLAGMYLVMARINRRRGPW